MSQNAVAQDPAALSLGFKMAMRRLTATVTVVTRGAGLERAGITATAVTSLSAEPPAVLVCVNRAASIHPSLALGSRFCINILGPAHIELASVFGGKEIGAARFETGNWDRDEFDVPFLADATALIFCIADRAIDYATHTIIIGRVYATHTDPAAGPLLYGDGKFLI